MTIEIKILFNGVKEIIGIIQANRDICSAITQNPTCLQKILCDYSTN